LEVCQVSCSAVGTIFISWLIVHGLHLPSGQKVEQGEIIIRQRGQRFHPGQDVYISKDHTIHAAIPGYVKFYQDPRGDHVGYRALSLRRQGMRKFVGVVADPDE
jgi:large subunit ribosomal protein L27